MQLNCFDDSSWVFFFFKTNPVVVAAAFYYYKKHPGRPGRDFLPFALLIYSTCKEYVSHVHVVSVGKSLCLNSKQMHVHKYGCTQQCRGPSQQRPFEVECFHSAIKNNFWCMFQVVPWTLPETHRLRLISYREHKVVIYVTAHLRQRLWTGQKFSSSNDKSQL